MPRRPPKMWRRHRMPLVDAGSRHSAAAAGAVPRLREFPETSALLPGKPRRYGCIISGGVGECRGGQVAAQCSWRRPLMVAQRRDQCRVLGRLGNDRDVLMILRRGADQCGPADIDIFDAFVEAGATRHGLGKGIEVGDEEVDRRDAVRGNGGELIGPVAPYQQPTMDRRMQCLDPALEHFRKARDLRDFAHRKAGFAQHLCRAARRDKLDARCDQPARQTRRYRTCREPKAARGRTGLRPSFAIAIVAFIRAFSARCFCSRFSAHLTMRAAGCRHGRRAPTAATCARSRRRDRRCRQRSITAPCARSRQPMPPGSRNSAAVPSWISETCTSDGDESAGRNSAPAAPVRRSSPRRSLAVGGEEKLARVRQPKDGVIAVMARLDPLTALVLGALARDLVRPAAQPALGPDLRRVVIGDDQRRMGGRGARGGAPFGAWARDRRRN